MLSDKMRITLRVLPGLTSLRLQFTLGGKQKPHEHSLDLYNIKLGRRFKSCQIRTSFEVVFSTAGWAMSRGALVPIGRDGKPEFVDSGQRLPGLPSPSPLPGLSLVRAGPSWRHRGTMTNTGIRKCYFHLIIESQKLPMQNWDWDTQVSIYSVRVSVLDSALKIEK